MTRRIALAGITVLPLARLHRAYRVEPASNPAFPDLRFDVLRNGDVIGRNNVTFDQEDGALSANTVIDIEVRLGAILLYRYAQTARETWRDGQFVSLDSETDDGGKHHAVHAMRSGDHVVARTANADPMTLPTDAIPMTHWNILCMERPLFNVQDGTAINSRIVPRGEDIVKLADGQTLRAERYSLIGKFAVDDWYDDSRHWASLRMTGSDGSTIEYRRVT
jgi:hypothetical protein